MTDHEHKDDAVPAKKVKAGKGTDAAKAESPEAESPTAESKAESTKATGTTGASVTPEDAAPARGAGGLASSGTAAGEPELEKQPPKAFLEVRDLRVHFPTQDGLVKSVDGLSFSLEKGKTLGIVGESGSGKSVTSLGLMGLHTVGQYGRQRPHLSGEIWLNGQELLTADPDEMRKLRGREISMIFQDPLSALHPFFTVGDQIVEAYRVHHKVDKKAARRRAIELLDRVGIPEPAKRFSSYPHEFSGGMRQRAMIAMSLVNNPELLIADEPTTALDVTVQAQILDLIRDLQQEFGSAVIIITHDLGVVAELSDDILVMYGGRCVEYGTAEKVFYEPQHPYTWGLLGSMPRIDRDRADRLIPVKGSPPSLINIPQGCAFNPRCPYADVPAGGVTRTERPELRETQPGHLSACHMEPEDRQRIWTEEIVPKL
ncbi:ABC transporter ATP-binding protein [Streptomyces iconiensis]|uniref:ABC transporter ATP-binding protein n=1 Tax=Streptomyces iconiensis TaxID=1384038 RepID=A0ABT7A786_9ACTN|nr:ABC transporter ATP-binding protein [Streptomyces iconiensis]MDJ1137205.1 ABC transporter ATP-binding protein [Streptomyces iconiensis]